MGGQNLRGAESPATPKTIVFKKIYTSRDQEPKTCDSNTLNPLVLSRAEMSPLLKVTLFYWIVFSFYSTQL